MKPNSVAQSAENDVEFLDRGSNQSGMRAHNERLVMTILRRSGPMAKSEIARATGLSAQTVSVIMRALEKDGLLIRGEPVRGKVGQPSVPMRLAEEGAYFGGLKIGRRSCDLVLTDFLGRVRSRARITYSHPTPAATLRFAHQAFDQLAGQLSPVDRQRISGLGIAMPFRLWEWAEPLGLEHSEMADWQQVNMRAEMEDALQLPVFLQNDASAACGAELVFGSGDRAPDFLYFYIGFFVGGGIVLNNRLYPGRSGNAGALGSLPVVSPEGKRGQLIDVASLCVLERTLVARGDDTSSLWEPPEAWNVDAGVLQAWTKAAADGLAQAIASAMGILDFQEVLIDGWIPAALRKDLIRETDAALARQNLSGIARPCVSEGTLGPDARTLGAASLPLSSKFLID